ncbi:UDP-2,3-diacylglucosamine diphosphatase LpxI domain-containing protein [uncultured Desulfobacter sp.]|uniref:LpxI family protein n=1 Tax=uncultured Desulfobacter sp. TaxID=240139 RepID=UPI002AAABA21|nr:UDP-2,3-diacylglucosamine diphosphatase LpxI [uncultured Desulfobacter sp.]
MIPCEDNSCSSHIGLIAGGGQFPLLFTRKAHAKGYKVIGVGFRSETDPRLAEMTHTFEWLYLGQLNKLIRYFKSHGVTQALLLGSVSKANIFKDIRPDFKALAFIAKTAGTHDDNILSSFADLLEKQGITLVPSTFLLPELISPKGCWTKRKPDRAEKKDIQQGFKLAKAVGRLDIGQCLVISNGTVLAVEAIDGTDATIERGGRLSRGNGATIVKLSKPAQDLRFDLPSTGCTTIETMHRSGVDVLVLEAEKSISFDREKMIALADQYNICITAVTEDEIHE